MSEVDADSSVGLLVKAQSGDNDAANRLLASYLPRLRRSASGRQSLGLQTCWTPETWLNNAGRATHLRKPSANAAWVAVSMAIAPPAGKMGGNQ